MLECSTLIPLGAKFGGHADWQLAHFCDVQVHAPPKPHNAIILDIDSTTRENEPWMGQFRGVSAK
jgi:hypothetical protein